jgi:hypothetical protein
MNNLTDKDLEDLRKAIKRLKKDSKAQKAIRKEIQETSEALADMRRKRRLNPEDWKEKVY